ncbi:MAG: hypothetical protein GX657_17185 [Chloroflexi bacterium]|nr:hypothetical protein [Chloroflexota bacterium]
MAWTRWLSTRLARRGAAPGRRALADPPREAGPLPDEAAWRPLVVPGKTPPWHETRATLERVEAACRSNPLAARLVGMTTDFVVGSGARLMGHPFAARFWHDPLNALDGRIHRWCDELSRAGELFLVLSRNPVTGMSYVREVPASRIDQVETDPDDLEREVRYHQLTDDPEGLWWMAPAAEGREAPDDEPDQVMLHYSINRQVGEVRGRSDLAQVVAWLDRYDLWLEDRVRISRYKGAYLWHVQVRGALPGHLEARRALYARIPQSGSIIVTDGNEEWRAIQPQIGADDVEADGKAIRLMIAAGVGVPLHFLAEGESANRATAREMGTATFRHFRHRQYVFAGVLEDVVRWAARRAGLGEVDVRVTLEPVPGPADDAAPGADAGGEAP